MFYTYTNNVFISVVVLQVIMASPSYNELDGMELAQTLLVKSVGYLDLFIVFILITIHLVVYLLNQQTNKLDDLLTTYLKGDNRNELRTDKLRKCLQTLSAEKVYLLLTALRNKYGLTAMYLAAVRGHVEVITCLLNAVTADQKYQLLMMQNEYGVTALHCAAFNGYAEAAMCIYNSVTAEQRDQLLKKQDKFGYTPLHFAAVNGHTKLIIQILNLVEPAQQSKLLNITDKFNRTVLDVALEWNNQSTADRIKLYQTEAIGEN